MNSAHIPVMKLFESNYHKLDALLPVWGGFELLNVLNDNSDVVFEIQQLSHSRYTDELLFIQQYTQKNPFLQNLVLSIRAYHDAKMAEVICYQNQRTIAARNRYPNPKMHQPDEKQQLNRFLGEWLELCLQRNYLLVEAESSSMVL